MKSALKLFFLACAVGFIGCTDTAEPTSEAITHGETVESEVLSHAEWTRSATIYEVNIRQHTPEGTIAAFEKDIPRLKEMGVDILWIMPINPIGKENRKGTKGSYYSIKDYYEVNPEFGDMADFQDMVATAHSQGMKVILDWVANHSAWDCEWVELHPEYYSRDEEGNMYPPVPDWSDVVDLNYDEPGLRDEMIKAMKFWLEVGDIDGFRCDVADMVPMDFWNRARTELQKVEPELFMLAEAENPRHHDKAFDMSYSWELMHIMNHIATGEMSFTDLDNYMAKEDTNFVTDAYRMTFTTNHDENSWNGTVFERYGPAHKMFATLAFTIQGMPLVYSGQEAGNAERLEFFEKDTIKWGNYELQDFYGRLLRANQDNEALWNGMSGGDFKRIPTEDGDVVYAFSRRKGDSQVITVLNHSDQERLIKFKEAIDGEYKSIFNGQTLSVFTADDLKLEPWGYQVFVK